MEKKISREIIATIRVKSSSERTTADALEVIQEAIDRMAWDDTASAKMEIVFSQDKVL